MTDDDSELSYDNRVDRDAMFVSALVSSLCNVFVLCVIYKVKEMHTTSFGLLVMQNFWQLLFAASRLAFFHPPPDHSLPCALQGFLVNMSTLGTVLCYAAMAVHMVFTIEKDRTNYRLYKLTRSLLLKIGVFIFAFSAVVSAVPLYMGRYQNNGPNCWVTTQNRDLLGFYVNYMPIWFLCLLCCISYISVYRYVSAQSKAVESSRLRTTPAEDKVKDCVALFLYYPAILLVAWIPITAVRMYNALMPHSFAPLWAITGAHITLGLMGVMDMLVFLRYDSVKKAWRGWVAAHDNGKLPSLSFAWLGASLSLHGRLRFTNVDERATATTRGTRSISSSRSPRTFSTESVASVVMEMPEAPALDNAA